MARGDPLAARPVEVDDRDLGALGGEQPGDLLADIAAGAGDDRDLILELHRVPVLASASPITGLGACRRQRRAASREALEHARSNAQNMDFTA